MSRFFVRILLISLFLIGSNLVASFPAHTKLSCTYVTKQAKSVFDQKWTDAQSKEPLREFSKRVSKSMSIVFSNQRCFLKSEITEMKNAIRDMQKQCIEAKKDEFTWSFMKDLCSAFNGVYKYAK